MRNSTSSNTPSEKPLSPAQLLLLAKQVGLSKTQFEALKAEMSDKQLLAFLLDKKQQQDALLTDTADEQVVSELADDETDEAEDSVFDDTASAEAEDDEKPTATSQAETVSEAASDTSDTDAISMDADYSELLPPTAAGESDSSASDKGFAPWQIGLGVVGLGVGVAALSGGGGGGHHYKGDSPAVTATQINGFVAMGMFHDGAMVTAYSATGEVLGSGNVIDGRFNFTLKAGYSGPVRFELVDTNDSGSNYFDEATNTQISLGDTVLQSMTVVDSGLNRVDVTLTEITTLAVKHALNLSNPLTAEVVNGVAEAISEALGFDILNVNPVTVDDTTNWNSDNTDSSQRDYGLLLAALSGAAKHTGKSIDALLSQLFNDSSVSVDNDNYTFSFNDVSLLLAGAQAYDGSELGLTDDSDGQSLALDYIEKLMHSGNPPEGTYLRGVIRSGEGETSQSNNALNGTLTFDVAFKGNVNPADALNTANYSLTLSGNIEANIAEVIDLGDGHYQVTVTITNGSYGDVSLHVNTGAMTDTDNNALLPTQPSAPAEAYTIDIVFQREPQDFDILTLAQIQSLTNSQIQSLTPEQLAAAIKNGDSVLESLTPAQIPSLTSEQVAVLTPAQVQSLTEEQMQALTPEQISALNTEQLAGLTPEQIQSLTEEQVQALTAEQLAATIINGDSILESLTPEQLGYLTGTQISELTAEQLGHTISDDSGTVLETLTPEQFASLTPEQLAAFTPEQIQSLSEEQVQALTAEQLATAISNGDSVLETLNPEQIPSLTTEQLAALTPDQIQSLTEEQVQALTSDQLAAVIENGDSVLETLTPEQLGYLTGSQISELTAEQLGHTISDDSGTLLETLTPEQIPSLSAGQLAELSPEQIEALTKEQVQALTAEQLADVINNNDSVLETLTPEQLGYLTGTQISELTAEQLGHTISDDSGTVLETLTPEQIPSLSAGQLAELSPEKIEALTKEQVQALTAEQLADVINNNDSVLETLTPEQLGYLTGTQISELTTEQLGHTISDDSGTLLETLTPEQIPSLTAGQLAELSPEQIEALTKEQVQALTAEQLADVINNNDSVLETLTPEQLAYLTESQIAALTLEQLGHTISDDSGTVLETLTPEQIPSLSAEQLAVLTDEQIAALSDEQVQALSLTQLATTDTNDVTLYNKLSDTQQALLPQVALDLSVDSGNSASDHITNEKDQTFTGSYSHLREGEEIQVSTNGTDWTTVTLDEVNHTWTLAGVELTEGDTAVTIRIVDGEGGALAQAAETVVLDTTAPQVLDDTPASASTSGFQLGFKEDIVISDINGISLSDGTDDVPLTADDISVVDGVLQLNVALDANKSYTLNLAEGAISDVAGNAMPATSLSATTPPSPTISQLDDNTDGFSVSDADVGGYWQGEVNNGGTTDDTTPTVEVLLTGSNAVAGDKLYINIKQGDTALTPVEYTIIDTDISNGSVSITLGTLGQGDYSVTAQIGEEGSLSGTYSFNIYDGSGDDVVTINNVGVTALSSLTDTITTGDGVDTLALSNTDDNAITLDLTDTNNSDKLSSIEKLDITGTANNTLELGEAVLKGLTDTVNAFDALYHNENDTVQLMIDGDIGDILNLDLTFLDYTQIDTVTDNGKTYRVLNATLSDNSTVQLLVNQDVAIYSAAVNTLSLGDVAIANVGVKFIGEAEYDRAGVSVSHAGDINGDGIDDVLVGAYQNDEGGNNAGATYLVYGKSDLSGDINLSDIGNSVDGVKFIGEAEDDYAGWSVSNAGDINGDGIDDLLVEANQNDEGGYNAGATYLVYGNSDTSLTGTINLSRIGSMESNGIAGVKFIGEAEDDRAGKSVSNAGDINGDGFDDVLVGAYYNDEGGNNAGATYLVYGKSDLSGEINLSDIGNGVDGVKFIGEAEDDKSGTSVSNAGDINGDGFDDVLVGANQNDEGGDNAGATYLVYGKSDLSGEINLSDIGNSIAGIKFIGEAEDDYAGTSVSNAGDINGDGFDDVLVGVTGVNSYSGASYLVYGKSDLSGEINLSDIGHSVAGVKFMGEAANDYAGGSVSNAGDINGDGIDDLLVGAIRVDIDGKSSVGATYLVYGGQDFDGEVNLAAIGDTIKGVKLIGENGSYSPSNDYIGDNAGTSVSNAGDINGDGFDDLVVGANGVNIDDDNLDAGAAYIIYGGPQWDSERLTNVVGGEGTMLADTLIGTSADDNLAGHGGNDLFYGFEGNDSFTLNNSNIDGLMQSADDEGYQAAAVNGGDGVDSLIIDNTDNEAISLDLTKATVAAKLDNIEKIDITGTANNTLNLGEAALKGLSSTANAFNDIYTADTGTVQLMIDGDIGDILNLDLTFLDYTQIDTVTDNGKTYRVINASLSDNSTVQLLVNQDVAIYSAAVNTVSLGDVVTANVGVKFIGEAGIDWAGTSVSNAGDINGDGFDDVLVGADGANAYAGATYLVYGKSDLSGDINLSDIGNSVDGVKFIGEAEDDESGTSVSNAGDINGDGIDDLLVGADGVNSSTGAIYLVYGNSDTPLAGTINLSRIGSMESNGIAGVKFIGEAKYNYAGSSVSNAGDINGDGIDDLLVGADGADDNAGATYLVYGGQDFDGDPVNLAAIGNSVDGVKFIGEAKYDEAGTSVSNAGDINGDGIDDVLVGATGVDGSTGATYLVYGKSDLSGEINLSDIGSSIAGVKFIGEAANDNAGTFVSNAGDINGDGIDDLLVGATGVDIDDKSNAGATYLVYGGQDFDGDPVNLAAIGNSVDGVKFMGEAEYDYAGTSVSHAGDINGDGIDDLLVGAYYNDAGGNNAGATYLVYGGQTFDGEVNLADIGNSVKGVKLIGENDGDNAGDSVSNVGDINGDGFDDLVVGATRVDIDDDNLNAGAAYIIYGGPQWDSERLTNVVGGEGTMLADTLIGTSADDNLAGHGGNDLFYGFEGNDSFTLNNSNIDGLMQSADDEGYQATAVNGGEGIDTLKFDNTDGNSISLDFTISDAGTKLSSIEKIDITGTADNELVLDLAAITGLSNTNNAFDDVYDAADNTLQLMIDGDAGDTVDMSFYSGTATATLDDYTVYTVADGVQVLIDNDVSVVLG